MAESGMRLLDKIGVAQKNARRPSCSVGVLFGQLAKQDAADLRSAIENQSIPASTIAHVLKAEGHNVQASAVRRHRNKQCACE